MPLDLIPVFRAAVSNDASDVLLTAGSPPIFRINGELVFALSESLDARQVQTLIYSILDNDQIARFERDRELDFSVSMDRKQRFRGNVYYQRGSVAAAFRLIRSRIPTLAELGLPPVLEELALEQQGLILVTGPTGHGKSTTQAAMIDLINQQKRCHIVTIEDPIEYIHKNKKSVIDQREVGQDTHNFAEALKHVLRQDPDIVQIGEMRDLESIAAALTAAETGHLVLTTVHTNDCVQAIDRLLDVFPPHQQGQVRTQLALSLVAVIAQRLLPNAEGSGRVVAIELLRNLPAVSHLIRDDKTHQIYTVMETHAREGMCTMDQSLKNLYLMGELAYDEALHYMRNPGTLQKVR